MNSYVLSFLAMYTKSIYWEFLRIRHTNNISACFLHEYYFSLENNVMDPFSVLESKSVQNIIHCRGKPLGVIHKNLHTSVILSYSGVPKYHHLKVIIVNGDVSK
jgi:hypothetical protein